MEVLNQIIHNRILAIPFLLWIIIQIAKVFIELAINKKFDAKRFVGAGGMPSSHSAVVCSLSVLLGREYGFDSGIYAFSFVMALVVMYDAAGIRRAAGKQAAIINKILETPGLTTVQVQEKLVELLGHTPIQVFVGAIIGIIVGMIF